MRKWGINAVLTVLVALSLGAAACGGGSSTTTSSSTTSGGSSGGTGSGGSSGSGGGSGGQSASTATAIASFSGPSQVTCTTSTTITLSWTTRNATSATISIDGGGIYASYPANGSASVPFACDGKSHTYLLTAKGPKGTATSTRVVSKAGGTTTSTTKK
ncbi:MAG: hypothetical protein E6G01_07135 [Actinobacteria bacterium]|nr:MAG: hypothetical protein E6G01_07135 [Actinomycetota bacterium]